jgi:hypothetical protein
MFGFAQILGHFKGRMKLALRGRGVAFFKRASQAEDTRADVLAHNQVLASLPGLEFAMQQEFESL